MDIHKLCFYPSSEILGLTNPFKFREAAMDYQSLQD